MQQTPIACVYQSCMPVILLLEKLKPEDHNKFPVWIIQQNPARQKRKKKPKNQKTKKGRERQHQRVTCMCYFDLYK